MWECKATSIKAVDMSSVPSRIKLFQIQAKNKQEKKWQSLHIKKIYKHNIKLTTIDVLCRSRYLKSLLGFCEDKIRLRIVLKNKSAHTTSTFDFSCFFHWRLKKLFYFWSSTFHILIGKTTQCDRSILNDVIISKLNSKQRYYEL